ncbi:MAG: hypothetical protein J7598_03525 [Mitsuaria chitosanitabida]|uniref:hypothetical protein n=1 Tax=Roseateles chitosanitabidus TaxID=65048 RepID=UPI001B04E14B|nr:hypothetical protein [Roseateles chitosanitabidus]MBO9685660.1 hypothetical protein [Roseateles chitosanitabidus]
MSAGHHYQREDLCAAGGFRPGYRAAVPPADEEIAARRRDDWERLRAQAIARGVVLAALHGEDGGVEYVAMLGQEKQTFDSMAAVADWLILSQQSEGKYFATLQARAALRGIQLVESHTERGDVEYIASWNARMHALPTLTEVDAWLDRVVGR